MLKLEKYLAQDRVGNLNYRWELDWKEDWESI